MSIFSQYRNETELDKLENYSNNFTSYDIKLSDSYIIKSKILNNNSAIKSKYLILLAGDAGNMSYLYEIGSKISESLNINVIFYDYRGTGINEPYDFGDCQISSLHIKDLEEVIKFYNMKLDKPEIYLNGVSLGGVIALNQYQNPMVKGIFIDSAPLNFKEFVNDYGLKVDNMNNFYSDLRSIDKILPNKKITVVHSLIDSKVDVKYVYSDNFNDLNIDYHFVNKADHGGIYNSDYQFYLCCLGSVIHNFY